MKVYLSGPISGKSYGGATNWRDEATRFLSGYSIETLDPMRGKASLQGQKVIEDQPEVGGALVADAAIFHRDQWDVQRCDVVFVYLGDSGKRVSIGTMFEMAWAHLHRKVVILILPADNVHEHAFVRQAAAMRVSTLEEGLQLVLRTAGVVQTADLSSSQ